MRDLLIILNLSKNRFYFFVSIFLFFGCEIEQTESDVYGCCHIDAWNYNSNVTVHVDSVCIYNFIFSNPTEESAWAVGETQIISWTGGDSNLDVRIAMHDSDTDLNEVLISGNAPNSGIFDWTVDIGVYDVGDKRIYFLQDLNSDDVIDTVNDLVTYSDDFCIGEYDECSVCNGNGQDDDDDDICDDVDDCVGEYDCAETCNGDATVDQCGECNGDGSSCEISPFEFLSPLEEDVWEQGSIQTISWTGGSEFLNITKLSLGDVNTNQTQGYIDLDFENAGTYVWTVDCFACLEGPKVIYIEQDLDGDGSVDLWKYSQQFTIISE